MSIGMERIRAEAALRHAWKKEPQDILTIVERNSRVHKNWQGSYCTPTPSTPDSDAPLFRVDETHQMYVCISCGEMWPYKTPKKV